MVESRSDLRASEPSSGGSVQPDANEEWFGAHPVHMVAIEQEPTSDRVKTTDEESINLNPIWEDEDGPLAQFDLTPGVELDADFSDVAVLSVDTVESELDPYPQDPFSGSSVQSDASNNSVGADQLRILATEREPPADRSMASDAKIVTEALKEPAAEWQQGEQENPAIFGEDEPLLVDASEETKSRRRLPPKYVAPVLSGESGGSTKRGRPPAAEQVRERPLSIYLRIRIQRRNQFVVTLLPERVGELAEEIQVNSSGEQETWSAGQDEWYGDVMPPNIGVLLEEGARWESPARQWVLSAREVYVLAPNSTIYGYVSTTMLLLNGDHLVLCTKNQIEAVTEALLEAGCTEPRFVEGNGVPEGWALFPGIRPTLSVHHEKDAGILNILRPVHSLQIVEKHAPAARVQRFLSPRFARSRRAMATITCLLAHHERQSLQAQPGRRP